MVKEKPNQTAEKKIYDVRNRTKSSQKYHIPLMGAGCLCKQEKSDGIAI